MFAMISWWKKLCCSCATPEGIQGLRRRVEIMALEYDWNENNAKELGQRDSLTQSL